MLAELHVRDLGVIADLRLVLGPGMTALTGETGAGKTLLVEAIELLVGGRADPVLVRPGADEALVEGRFLDEGHEVVLARAVPAGGGRSRGYVDGRMASIAALAEAGAGLVDLHGQHAHQSLLAASTQRSALDTFAHSDPGELAAARAAVREIDTALDALGGDARSRAREADLLRFQLTEIEGAAIEAPAEEEALELEEDRLSGAAGHRDAAAAALEAVVEDSGAIDALGTAVGALAGHEPLRELADRLRDLQAELADVGVDLRSAAESFEDDPERLARVRARRQQLRDLRRKYGESLSDVLAFAEETARRLDELESHEVRVAALEQDRAVAVASVAKAAAVLGRTRRKAAAALADAVEVHLRRLALPRARLAVDVGEADPGDDVTFLFAANPGEPLLPLTKIASGGELARTMLAARLVLSESPGTLVFDEVDAGVGGEAALAVGRALAELAANRQVLVVTHLPQVAAFADAQVRVAKDEHAGRTVATVTVLDDAGRVVELSRMMSGQPESKTARGHAEELLASAARERGR